MSLIPVSRDAHARTRLRPLSSFAFAATTTAVSLSIGEVVAMAQELPIFFSAEAEGFTPAALMGLGPNQNLLIDEHGRWLGHHIPWLWQRGPFRSARAEGSPDLLICLDDSSDRLSETEGAPLFGADGAPTDLLAAASRLLARIESDRAGTTTICATLDRLGLIVPWDLTVEQASGEKQRIAGLFKVDEARIAGLSGNDLVTLRDCGALPLMYAHLMSLSRISVLGRLARQADERARQRNAVKDGKLNLDRAFGIVEDDPFIF